MTTPFPFVSGAVLTAAQLNAITEVPVSTKTASYTLAATDAGSRITMSSASATTITVNTGLFTAGQSLRIQNLNGGGVCTVTAGTATVTSAGPLAIPSWGGGQLYFTSASAAVWFPDAVTATPGALTLITAQTIGSAVSSVTVSGAFSSSYENYRIIVNGGVGSATAAVLMTLGATATGYSWGLQGADFAGTGSANGAANTSSRRVLGSTATATSGVLDILSPNLAKPTTMTGSYLLAAAGGVMGNVGGYLDNSTQYTAFTITPSTGTLTGGTIRVYGYSNS
jgi:hypothetical protein